MWSRLVAATTVMAIIGAAAWWYDGNDADAWIATGLLAR